MAMVFAKQMELANAIPDMLETIVQVGPFSSMYIKWTWIISCFFCPLLFPEFCLASSTCNDNGVCKADGTCQCNSGYFGNDCSSRPFDFLLYSYQEMYDVLLGPTKTAEKPFYEAK